MISIHRCIYKLFILLFLLVCYSLPDQVVAQPSKDEKSLIRIALHHSGEPFNYRLKDTSSVGGLIPDILSLVSAKTDQPIELIEVPLERTIYQLIDHAVDFGALWDVVLVDLASDSLLECLPLPLFTTSLYLYASPDRETPIDRIKIGLYRYAVLKQEKEELPGLASDSRSYEVIHLSTPEALFKSLVSERVNLVISTPLSAKYWGDKLAVDFQQVRFVKSVELKLCYLQARRDDLAPFLEAYPLSSEINMRTMAEIYFKYWRDIEPDFRMLGKEVSPQ